MNRDKVFEKFCAAAPFAVLSQLILRWSIGDKFQQIFEEHRGRQYDGKLLFPALANAVADVALGVCDNPNQAYRRHREELSVARSSFYDKLRGISGELSEAVVRFSAKETCELQDALNYRQWEVLSGRRVLVVDGDHLEKTDKRLEEIRDLPNAALPATVVARFDLGRQVFDRAYMLPDAHQQESTCCGPIADDLEEGDVLMADRHYCIVAFMEQIAAKQSFFIIRHHGRLKGELIGQRRKLGRISTGTAYEQEFLLSKNANSLKVRRLTVELDQPTQDGDLEVHLLTNLPEDGKEILAAYPSRWDIEYGFYYLKTCLNSELKSLGHPQTVLFAFAMAMHAFNVFQIIKAALYAEKPEQSVEELSLFYVSLEIEKQTAGMLVMLEDEDWNELIPQNSDDLARLLRHIAHQTDLKNYQTSRRDPKKPKKRKSNEKSKHVSTGKLLGLKK